MRARFKLAASWLRRSAWVAAFVALGIGVILALPVATASGFYPALVATYIGAALGFLVAIYVDRLQRAEDDAASRQLQEAADERERAREAEIARARRVAVLSLLREELGRVPNQMGKDYRQNRNEPPPSGDRLTDVLWRSLSTSGDLRWIEDLDLLQRIASTYDLLAVEIELEKQWHAARALRGEGKVVSYDHFANELKVHDFKVWTGACRACKAMDAALVADGASGGDDMFCPHG
jgi:hypothetical protein